MDRSPWLPKCGVSVLSLGVRVSRWYLEPRCVDLFSTEGIPMSMGFFGLPFRKFHFLLDLSFVDTRADDIHARTSASEFASYSRASFRDLLVHSTT